MLRCQFWSHYFILSHDFSPFDVHLTSVCSHDYFTWIIDTGTMGEMTGHCIQTSAPSACYCQTLIVFPLELYLISFWMSYWCFLNDLFGWLFHCEIALAFRTLSLISNLNMPFLFLVKHSKSTTNDSFVYCILFLSSCKIPHVMGRRLSIQHVAHSEET